MLKKIFFKKQNDKEKNKIRKEKLAEIRTIEAKIYSTDDPKTLNELRTKLIQKGKELKEFDKKQQINNYCFCFDQNKVNIKT